jgi:hypothetical protein
MTTKLKLLVAIVITAPARSLLCFLLLSALSFAQANKPTPPSPVPALTAPAPTPDKRPLSPDQAARMKSVDATQAQFEMKIDELIQMVQRQIQNLRNEIWAEACKAAGWIKPGECGFDTGANGIVHHQIEPEAVKQEPATGK